MSEKLLSITRKIVRVGNIGLTSVAFFPRDKLIVSKRYTPEGNHMMIDFPAFLRLENCICPRGVDIDRRNISLTNIGKIQMIAAMKKMLRLLSSGGVFVDDPEMGLTVTQNLDEHGGSKWTVFERIGDHSVVFTPTVVNEDETQYEGVTVIMNVPTNMTTISVSEFAILAEAIQETNIWLESQLLFMTALQMNSTSSDELAEEYVESHSKLDDIESKALRKVDKP